ncbi:MAG: ABC transporter permease [Candidatus Micrarchaeota archaeon]
MNTLEILQLAVNSIRYRSLRSWLAILGVVIGVASIISLISISTGLNDQIQSQLSGLGAQVITITSGGGQASRVGFGGGPTPGGQGGGGSSKPLTFKEADQLRHLAGVAVVDARLSERATISYRNKNTSLSVIGTEPQAFLSSANVQVLEGRSLRNGDATAAVIGYGVMNATFQDPNILNKPIKINGHPFRVVGILNASGASFSGSDDTVFIPQKTAKTIFSQNQNASSIVVLASNSSDPNVTATVLTNELLKLHKVTAAKQDFRVTTAASIQSTISSAVGALGLFLGVIASISLVVGGIGVANAMFTSVLEQTKYIGILKALGTRSSDILKLFLFEAGLVGLVGGVLGVALSFVGSYIVSSFGLPTRISIDVVALGMLFSVGVGVVSGVFPARNAASVPPVEALRYE